MKRCALDGRCHPTFGHFHAAIQEALGAMLTKHFRQPASLTTQILQQFDDASSLRSGGASMGPSSRSGASFPAASRPARR